MSLILFDGTLGSSPADQGQLTLQQILPPPLAPAASETVEGETVILDTNFNGDNTGYAGYTNYDIVSLFPPEVALVNSEFPDLVPDEGFTISFDVAVNSEESVTPNRAGFSVIVVSSDGSGEIELGFAEDRIFAQADGFVSGEEVAFDTTDEIDYELEIEGSSYRLFADGTQILTGPLRDYDFDPAVSEPPLPFSPYDLPNFLFFGDNTDQSSATFTLDEIAVEIEEEPPISPVAGDDVVSTDADTPIEIDVLANDTAIDSDPQLTDFPSSSTAGGAISRNNNGTPFDLDDDRLDYTPAAGFTGEDSFTYTISDGTNVDTAIVTVAVGTPNIPPLAVNDTASTEVGTSVTIDVLANDSDDPDGDEFQLFDFPSSSFAGAISRIDSGTPSDLTDDLLEYTPAAGFTGTDSFLYTISDGNGAFESATVTVIVVESEPPPNPVEVNVTIENLAPEGGTFVTPLWVGFQDGTFDIFDSGSSASLSLERVAEDGDVSLLSEEFLSSGSGVVDGVLGDGPLAPGDRVMETFTLDSNDEASRYFSYAAMIVPSNDAFIANGNPTRREIFDEDGNFVGTEFVVVAQQVKDAGTEENDELPENTAFFGQTTPNTGVDENGVVMNHPGFNPVGSGGILDSEMFANADFTAEGYELARITVSLDTPIPIDDPVALTGVLTGDQEVPPVETEATGTVEMLLNEAGDAISYSLTVSGLDFGEFIGDGTPQTPETDDDVTGLHIHSAPRGENGPIVFGIINPNQDDDDVTFTLNDDGSTTISGIGEETDPANEPLSDFVEALRAAEPGEELPLYWNIHTVEFPMGEIRAQLQVTPLNSDPVAEDDSAETEANTLVEIEVLDNDSDVDGDPLTLSIVTPPSNGTAEVDDDDIDYTPDDGFEGTDTFTYQVDDGNGGTDTATVTVTVSRADDNNDPVAEDDIAQTLPNTLVEIDVLDNDSDADGDPLTLSIVTPPSNGTAEVDDDDIDYTPDDGFEGTDTFTYQVDDGNGGVDTATVTVTVEPDLPPTPWKSKSPLKTWHPKTVPA